MATEYIYNVISPVAEAAGHFLATKRKVRKAPADASKLRPYQFAPMAPNGTDRAKVARYTVTDPAVFEAWRTAADDGERAAALSGIEPLETASAIAPTRPQVLAALATFGQEVWSSMLASGWLAYPSDRAERASGTAANGRALTAEEKHAAALADMFAELETTTATDGDSESDAEPVSDNDVPEVPATKSSGKAR